MGALRRRSCPPLVFARTLSRRARHVPSAARRWMALPAADRRGTLRAFAVLLFVEATIRWIRIPRLATSLGLVMGSDTSSQLTSRTFESNTLPSGVMAPDVDDGERRRKATARARPYSPDELSADERLALRATVRVIRHWPFGSGPCLRESLVLGHLLRDRTPELRFGVARSHGRILAHAWVEAGGRPINDPRGVVPLRGPTMDP